MSVENGKVCSTCRHCLRLWDDDNYCHCKCEVKDTYLGYMAVMTDWCRHWAKGREEE